MLDEEKISTENEEIEKLVEEEKEEVIEEVENPYEKELKRLQEEKDEEKRKADEALEAEKAERKRLMEIKDKAIKEEKEKTKFSKEEIKEELRRELRQERIIDELTSDPSEKKLIEYHLKNSIRSTGDPDKDVELAYAIANANLIKERKAQDEQEDRSLSSMGASIGKPSRTTSRPTSQTSREAEKLARSLAGGDKELEKKYISSIRKRVG